MGEVEPIDLG